MRRVPWVVLAVLAVVLGSRGLVILDPIFPGLPECMFKRLTGFACASCGLTRCLLAVGRWDWPAAFHWHPAVASVLLLSPMAALWDLRRAWRGEPYPVLPDSRGARAAAWILLSGVWVLQVVRGI